MPAAIPPVMMVNMALQRDTRVLNFLTVLLAILLVFNLASFWAVWFWPILTTIIGLYLCFMVWYVVRKNVDYDVPHWMHLTIFILIFLGFLQLVIGIVLIIVEEDVDEARRIFQYISLVTGPLISIVSFLWRTALVRVFDASGAVIGNGGFNGNQNDPYRQQNQIGFRHRSGSRGYDDGYGYEGLQERINPRMHVVMDPRENMQTYLEANPNYGQSIHTDRNLRIAGVANYAFASDYADDNNDPYNYNYTNNNPDGYRSPRAGTPRSGRPIGILAPRGPLQNMRGPPPTRIPIYSTNAQPPTAAYNNNNANQSDLYAFETDRRTGRPVLVTKPTAGGGGGSYYYEEQSQPFSTDNYNYAGGERLERREFLRQQHLREAQQQMLRKKESIDRGASKEMPSAFVPDVYVDRSGLLSNDSRSAHTSVTHGRPQPFTTATSTRIDYYDGPSTSRQAASPPMTAAGDIGNSPTARFPAGYVGARAVPTSAAATTNAGRGVSTPRRVTFAPY